MRLLSSDYNPLKVNREDLRFLVFVSFVSLRQRIIQGVRVIPFHMILGTKVIARSQHASNRKQKKLTITLAEHAKTQFAHAFISYNTLQKIKLAPLNSEARAGKHAKRVNLRIQKLA